MLWELTLPVFFGAFLALVTVLALMGKLHKLKRGPRAFVAWLNGGSACRARPYKKYKKHHVYNQRHHRQWRRPRVFPTTAAPAATTAAPASSMAPTAAAPATMAPTTMAPATMAPTSMAPVTAMPTVAPSTVAPATHSPSMTPTSTPIHSSSGLLHSKMTQVVESVKSRAPEIKAQIESRAPKIKASIKSRAPQLRAKIASRMPTKWSQKFAEVSTNMPDTLAPSSCAPHTWGTMGRSSAD